MAPGVDEWINLVYSIYVMENYFQLESPEEYICWELDQTDYLPLNLQTRLSVNVQQKHMPVFMCV